ncbi:prolyl 4-hydroxylase subunit alpha [Marinobacterium nitratireducens]|uniref:Prolyl 4-hydroxylase subunit alpha n=1 Tax=Marinobacterium nitratireducens TaxID=518897 RepID=A0A917Z8W4_9GAMM|nr:2OG-Fe(II) oxygenase [Marinobacterium nitratireducens]GGO78216.1 prolyl 4-hydroxylase subunit alpha [Marinobacterium nitratireducens]
MNAITPLPVEAEALFDRIADALAETGYCIIPDALPENLTLPLHRYLQRLHDEDFHRAGIGRDQEHQLNRRVRGDEIRWLSPEQPEEARYLEWMSALRLGINRRLMMGLFDYECHFARYPEGAFYRRHLDAFQGRTNRVLSTVYYLNPDWSADDGGELLIYADEQSREPLERVLPTQGTLVVFLSDRFPHEVLPARRERLSVTGWYRVNNSLGGQVDPPR